MQITLYNTLTRSKDQFVAIDEIHKKVKLYSCGPTVYGDPHIGNMRAYVFVDLLKSVLTHIGGYEVHSVMNITDVGHLTDDGDQGEDKMEKGARREQKTVREVARMYEANFKKYSDELKIAPPSIGDKETYTRATEYIQEQIQMVHTLTDVGYTYIIEGDGVYMDTSKVPDYGKLALLDFDGMNSDHRVDGAKIDSSKKRNLSDFALWKFSRPGEERSMERVYTGDRAGYMIVQDDFDPERFVSQSEYQSDLQWVRKSDLTEDELATHGFPGWHIECSAMASAELGNHIDIHTGGVDHITVHHTNEIAQAECSLGCSKWVNRWMHGQFLQIGGSKVSKSKGDDLSVAGIIAKEGILNDGEYFSPEDLRYFYLTAHYRSFLNFDRDILKSARKTRKNIIDKCHDVFNLQMSDEQRFDSFESMSELINEISNRKVSDFNFTTEIYLNHYNSLINPLVDDLSLPKLLANFNLVTDFLKERHPNEDELDDYLLLVDFICWIDYKILKVGIYQCLPAFCRPRWSDEVCDKVFDFYDPDVKNKDEIKSWLFDNGMIYIEGAGSRIEKTELKKNNTLIPDEIQNIAQQRLEAKSAKDRALADSLRDQITDAGWSVQDTADGFELEML